MSVSSRTTTTFRANAPAASTGAVHVGSAPQMMKPRTSEKIFRVIRWAVMERMVHAQEVSIEVALARSLV